MADYFLLTEIIKYFPLDNNSLFYYKPFIFYTKMTTINLSESYFITIFGAIDVTNKEVLNIQGVYIDIDNFYPPQESLNDCENNIESMFFDGANQFLYIHFNHNINPYSAIIEYGKTFGYSNDGIRNFNGIDYIPELKSIPNYQQAVDPLQYKKQSFYGGNVIYNNTSVKPGNNGNFDNDMQLHGNDINILFGENGNSYLELKKINKNYIDKTDIDFNQAVLKTKDKREQQSIKIPNSFFTKDEYQYLDDDTVDKLKPDGYGFLIGIPGICINFNETVANKKFYFCSEITSVVILKAKKDNLWTVITPVSIDYNNGIIEISNSDAFVDGNTSKGLNEIKADLVSIDIRNPADIISDLNYRFLNVPFNNTNYNISEWNEEKQYLENVALYLDSQKESYQYIELLQNGSTVGFQYMIEYGKRTIRLDNPNREPIFNIEAIEIINNNNLKKNNNEELYATDTTIYYFNDHDENKSLRYDNIDYKNDVFREHRKYKNFSVESLMNIKQDAINKSFIIMEDMQKTRFIIDVVLSGIKYFDLRIYDIIYIELSYPGEIFKTIFIDGFYIKFSGTVPDGIYVTRNSTDLYKKVNYRRKDIYINYRKFLGWQRMQVIGLFPDFFNGTINVRLRQRDYSEKFAEITGYIP